MTQTEPYVCRATRNCADALQAKAFLAESVPILEEVVRAALERKCREGFVVRSGSQERTLLVVSVVEHPVPILHPPGSAYLELKVKMLLEREEV